MYPHYAALRTQKKEEMIKKRVIKTRRDHIKKQLHQNCYGNIAHSKIYGKKIWWFGLVRMDSTLSAARANNMKMEPGRGKRKARRRWL